MPSGLVRIAIAGAQNNSGKGKAGNNRLATLLKSQKSMKDAYPVKAKKRK